MKKEPPKEFILTLSDFWGVCRRSKKFLIKCVFFSALLFATYAMTRPVEYEAEASFREKATSPNSMGNSGGGATFLVGMLDDGKSSSALSILQSRTLLEELAEEKQLQVFLREKDSQDSIVTRIWKNSKAIFAKLLKKQFPVLEDPQITLVVKEAYYEKEVPTYLIVTIGDLGTFDVHSKEREELIGKGRLGEKFYVSGGFFTLREGPFSPKVGTIFQVDLLPKATIAKHLQEKIEIVTDKKDKNLFRFTFRFPNRHLASETLNAFLNVYLRYLKSENQRVAKEQLHYLTSRQEEVEKMIRDKMEEYASSIQDRLTASGFPSTLHAMEFLSESQKEFRSRLHKISLDHTRFHKVLEEGAPYWTHFPADLGGSSEVAILTEIRSLRQQLDALHLALKNEEEATSQLSMSIKRQMEALKRIKGTKEEVEGAIAALEKGKPLPNLDFLSRSPYLALYWQETLKEQQNEKDKALYQKQFLSYLTNLKHLLFVEEKANEESSFQIDPKPSEFQGLSLEASLTLFSSLNGKLSDLEGTIAQYDFLIDQVLKPDVDLSTLPTFVEDPIANAICTSSLEMILAFKDQDNRSAKEQRHLDEALNLRRNFLLQRFEQSQELLRLRVQLLRRKLLTLRDVAAGLISQKIALLDQHLAESCKMQLERVTREKKMLKGNQEVLLREMLELPEKWVSEKLIDQQLEVNRRMVEEVTKLVESKIIAKNLDVTQSTPVDLALPPLHPTPPKLAIWLLLGASLGGLTGLTGCLVSTVRKGVPATLENLTLLGYLAAGRLSCVKDKISALCSSDLDVLRKSLAFHQLHQKGPLTLLIITHGEMGLGKLFAEMLAYQGKKVCLVPLSFEGVDGDGILPYLEGKRGEPTVHHGEIFDYFEAGGTSRFTSELIERKAFKELFSKLLSSYDMVIGVSSSSIASGEAKGLFASFHDIIIRIEDETLPEIQESTLFFEGKCVSFIF